MKNLTLLVAFIVCLSFDVYAGSNNHVKETTPTNRFVLNGDGTATDIRTGLTWMRYAIGQSWVNGAGSGVALKMNWKQALSAAEGANYSNASNWRLPNIRELKSIVEDRCYNPSINTIVFQETPSRGFWSSSRGMGVDFSNGADHYYTKDGGLYVRLVRETP